MPLVRLDEGVVLEPDGSNRLTLLNADKAVKRWGFAVADAGRGARPRRRAAVAGRPAADPSGAWRVAE